MFFVFIMSACSNRDSHNEEVPEAPLIEEPVGADSDFTVENMEMEDVLYRREFYFLMAGIKLNQLSERKPQSFFMVQKVMNKFWVLLNIHWERMEKLA